MDGLLTSPARRAGEKHVSARAAGYLLQKPGLLGLCAVLLIAAWAGRPSIVMLAGLFLSAALIARSWAWISLKGVYCNRSLPEDRFFPGESTNLEIRVTNRKPLPLAWFSVEQELPTAVSGDLPLQPSERPQHGLLRLEGALLWYRSMRWKRRLVCRRRGYYRLGPMVLTSGDIFGFYTNSMHLSRPDHLIVYPSLFPVERMSIPSLQPMGESRLRRPIIQDPTRIVGLREYRPGDNLRHIHWKASARSRRLQVKTFEATTSYKAALFLAVESFDRSGPGAEEEFELAISAAASMARYLVEHGSPVGVFVNTRCAESGEAVSLPPSGRREQLSAILEGLAMVTPESGDEFDRFLESRRGSLSAGTTVVLLFGRRAEKLPRIVSTLKSSGYNPFVISIGAESGFSADEGIVWKNVRNSEDLRRI